MAGLNVQSFTSLFAAKAAQGIQGAGAAPPVAQRTQYAAKHDFADLPKHIPPVIGAEGFSARNFNGFGQAASQLNLIG